VTRDPEIDIPLFAVAFGCGLTEATSNDTGAGVCAKAAQVNAIRIARDILEFEHI
jgi:hypothetical protein